MSFRPSLRFLLCIFSLSLALLLSACDNDSEKESIAKPTINLVSPNEGPPGATIAINGSNFSSTATSNEVTFNGSLGTVVAATATELTVLVPNDATTGKITVTVDGQSVSTTQDFVVISTIPVNGLVVYFPFNGNAEDESGNGHLTNVTGAVLDDDRFGNDRKCFYFDGQDDIITVANSLMLDISPSITVAAWVKLKPNILSILLSKFGVYGGNTSKGYSFVLREDNNSKYGHGFVLRDASNNVIVSAGDWPSNEWVFIAASSENGIARIFLHGEKIAEVPGSQNLANTDSSVGDLLIGRGTGAGVEFPFNGWADEIAIYNRALSDDEIKSFYLVTKVK